MQKYCPECGKKLKNNSKFCPEYGKKIILEKSQDESEKIKETSTEQIIDKDIEKKESKQIINHGKKMTFLKSSKKNNILILILSVLSAFFIAMFDMPIPWSLANVDISISSFIFFIDVILLTILFYFIFKYVDSKFGSRKKQGNEKTSKLIQKKDMTVIKKKLKINKNTMTRTKKALIIIIFAILASVVLFLIVDADGDGLNNLSEIQHGTAMFNSDSDADGLNDGKEIHIYGTNPLDGDCDKDNITDGAEINLGTNPLSNDSDSDGLSDYAEIYTYHTNPLNTDSDSDSLNDRDEVKKYGTNPLSSDSDSDGLNDNVEVNTYHTNPLNNDSDNDGLDDYKEIFTYQTNPLDSDYDKDGLKDGDEIKLGTDPFNADTDGDGAPDGYDAHPLETSRKYTRNYEWEYPAGRIWTWTIDVSYDLYEYESKLNRIRSWSEWPEYTLDPTAKQLANKLKEAASEKGFNYYQTVNFVLAFVQSLPYTSDDVTTGADEYPRYPLETLVDGGGDCEDTSILLSSILREMNYDNCLVVFTSPVGHAMVGVWGHSNYQGSYSTKDGKNYYFCETTGDGRKMGYLNSMFSSSEALLYSVETNNPITPPIPNEEPTVSVIASSISGHAPLTVSFSSTASDPDGSIVSYSWNFGDGSTTSQENNPIHTFNEEGSFTVTLAVVDNIGTSATASITIQVEKPSNISLNPTDDTYVDSTQPNKNYGNEQTLSSWYFSGYSSTIMEIYIMFDLSNIHSGVTVQNAQLKLYALYVGTPADVEIYRCSDTSWDESSVTWNNAPSYSSSYENKVFINSKDRWYSWDVTKYVQDYQTSDKIAFVLRTRTSDGSPSFYSKEYWSDNNKHPILEIGID